jgi:hypothetical protein
MDLIAHFLGTQERPAIFGGEDRMNEKMGEGLVHEVLQRHIMLLLSMQIQSIPPL